MIRILIMLLGVLPLVSFAPVPRARHTVYWTRLAIQTGAPRAQECSYESTETHLRQPIFDPISYPYGFVQAYSCTGDALAVARELAERAAAMQAEAAAYRQAHPITGATP